jgi:putative toxin-antitoxin system antitoxin component (TIGR02293 family)
MQNDCSCEDFAMSKAVASKPAIKASPTKVVVKTMPLNFLSMYRAEPLERIRIVNDGIPARTVEAMAKRMAVPKERLIATLGLTRATVDRKARDNRPLSIDESVRVFGMARLVGQVQEMVAKSGDPAGFDAASWVARWLQSPLPAFGGKRPAGFMDTADGQLLVSTMVARMQSGAYA